MKKYLALYLAPVPELEKMMKSSTPEDMKKGMEDWMKWSESKGKSIVDLGTPLGKTKRVTARDISDVKNEVAGYTLVQADSHDARRRYGEETSRPCRCRHGYCDHSRRETPRVRDSLIPRRRGNLRIFRLRRKTS